MSFIPAAFRSPAVQPSPRLLGAAVLAALTMVVALAAGAGARGPEPERRITFPIEAARIDDVYWTDTWGAPRSGGRTHIGVDIMGAKMIPLVAANDSVVTWGEFDNAGGNIVRLRDDAGWEYQYIHINNDTPGTDDGRADCRHAFVAKICDTLDGHRIQRGLRFSAGEVIGYLGDSGNAEWTAPHLHFEVYKPTGGRATAVNPTPFVDWAVNPPDDNVSPEHAEAEQLFETVSGRQARSGEVDQLAATLGDQGRGAAIAAILEQNSQAAKVDRLYRTFFRRSPGPHGLDYWTQRGGQGHSLETIAEWFARSQEFQNRYGNGTFEDFLDQLYADLLGRQPQESGKEYWLERLRRGEVSRGTVVVHFSEGEEARRLYQHRTERAVLAHILGGDAPTEAEFNQWSDLRSSGDLAAAVAAVIG